MKKSYRNRSKRRNGGATVMPLSYYNPGAVEPAANAGRDLLKSIGPIGIRPRIGGKYRRYTKKNKKTKGGFVPSVMEGFVVAASKYITPLALFAGYKLMTKKKGKKVSHRSKTRRH